MIELIHRSHGIHETVLHQVCVQEGLYEACGVGVALADGTGRQWGTASAREDAATVAVGGVVADRLRGDDAWEVHFVATVKPLMWVVGTAGTGGVEELRGRRIATPPRAHMPSLFLRLILERHGLDLATDVEIVEVTQRPDRQRLLEAGEVDAALLGPEGLGLADPDLVPVVYVGDQIEFPTVGLAARPGADRADLLALATAMADGLALLREDEGVAVSAMRAVDPQVPEAVARRVARDVIAPDWAGPEWAASSGTSDVGAVAALLGVEPPSDAWVRAFLQSWAGGSGS